MCIYMNFACKRLLKQTAYFERELLNRVRLKYYKLEK